MYPNAYSINFNMALSALAADISHGLFGLYNNRIALLWGVICDKR